MKTCGTDHHYDGSLDQICDFTCDAGACVAASNLDLADVKMCDSSAPALAPQQGATISFSATPSPHIDCTPNCGDPSVTTIPALKSLAVQSTQGVALFCVSSLTIPAAFAISANGSLSQAVAFVVDGDVTIDGVVSFDGGAATNGTSGGRGSPGGWDGATRSKDSGHDGSGPCKGSGGTHNGPAVIGSDWSGGGGGGGGNQTIGGVGGTGDCVDDDHRSSGGTYGAVCGVDSISPLVGGSGGGGGGDATSDVEQGWAGGGGGGALQISARRSITIHGTVSARGGNGYGTATIDGGGGGGAGGGLLFEAPSVMITGSLNVDGGQGGPSKSGPGGVGATGTQLSASGLNYNAAGQGGSGGGGGGGRIRIVGGNATCVSDVSPTSSCTAAMLAPAP
ncbi:MAG: hypothetical protein QM831_03400 [Kofleriaceae bacterium]